MWKYQVVVTSLKIAIAIATQSLKKYSEVVLYDRHIIGTSLEIFGYLRQSSENVRKMFGDARQAFGTILENLRNSSESGRKSSESRMYVYIINRIIHGHLEIWSLSSRVHIRYLARSFPSLVQYQCEHSKINSISPRVHVLFSITLIIWTVIHARLLVFNFFKAFI